VPFEVWYAISRFVLSYCPRFAAFQECYIRISAGMPSFLTDDFRELSQFLQYCPSHATADSLQNPSNSWFGQWPHHQMPCSHRRRLDTFLAGGERKFALHLTIKLVRTFKLTFLISNKKRGSWDHISVRVFSIIFWFRHGPWRVKGQ
jgi:hypothetical protein